MVISEADQPWREFAELSAPLLHPPFGHRPPLPRRKQSMNRQAPRLGQVGLRRRERLIDCGDLIGVDRELDR